MPTYRKGDIVVVLYPFSDGSGSKPRPGLVVSDDATNHQSRDVILAQITSRLAGPQMRGDHVLTDWQVGHLDTPSKVKAGRLVTVEVSEVRRIIGRLSPADLAATERQLRIVLGL